MGRRVTIATDNRHPRLRQSELRTNHMHDTLARIAEIEPGLPTKILPDGRLSRVTVVPFYDRTGLIYETLGTLNTALVDEIFYTPMP